jgi:hypothetical protein
LLPVVSTPRSQTLHIVVAVRCLQLQQLTPDRRAQSRGVGPGGFGESQKRCGQAARGHKLARRVCGFVVLSLRLQRIELLGRSFAHNRSNLLITLNHCRHSG